MDPILQILLENLRINCQFYRSGHCRRRAEIGDIDDGPYTSCEGNIRRCERSQEELFGDPPS